MATLASDLVSETRRHLLSGAPETLSQINAVNASATTITLARDLRNIAAGATLSVGLETMYVWAVTNEASRTLEVLRGHQGSTVAAHATGDLVHVNPPHTDFAIFTALNAELDSLSDQGVYAMKTLDLVASSTGVVSYDLAADVLDVYDVAYDDSGVENDWPRVASWSWRGNFPTTEFASGAMLRLDSPVPAGRPIRVLYKAALAHLTALTDNVVTATGVPASALDIPPLGATWALTAPSEVQRNQTQRQGDSRRAEEVPQGAKLRASTLISARYQRRVREERNRLATRWPGRPR